MNKKIKKLISLLILPVLLLTSVPSGEVFSLEQAHNTNYRQAQRSVSGPVDVDKILLPRHLGYIDSRHKGSSGKVVFHIKDAHCNYNAQKSIYRIIDWLVDNYGVKLVNLEGARGEYDMGILERIRDPFVKRDIIEKYTKLGLISAAESYRAFNPSEINLAGVENDELYQENLDVYMTVLAHRERIDSFLLRSKEVLGSLKEELFSARLRRFLKKQQLFDSGSILLEDYAEHLLRMAEELSYPVERVPNLVALHRVLDLEKDIDLEGAVPERQRLIEELTVRLSRYERERLASVTDGYERDLVSQADLYLFLKVKALETGMDTELYRRFFSYCDYLCEYEAIEEEELIREVRLLEEDLAISLAGSPEQEEILGYIRQVRLLEKLFSLAVKRGELHLAKRKIDINGLLAAIKENSPTSFHGALEEDALHVSYCFESMMLFYALTRKRDEVFVYNIRENMVSNRCDSCVLVTGGFHSDNLAEHFKKSGISHVTISPRFVNEPGYTSPYMELLSGRADVASQGVLSFLSSSIQIKSLWSPLGVDTDFAATLLLRLNAAIDAAVAEGSEGILIKLGEHSVLLLRSMGYKPAPVVPDGQAAGTDYSTINISDIMGTSSGNCIKRIKGFMEPEVDFSPAKGYTGNKNMADIIKALVAREGASAMEFTEGVALKKAYLRTYEGRLVEQKLKGIGDVDTFDYVLDVTSGVLTCQFSCSRTFSGYMSNPSVVKGRNEKSYLCRVLRRLYRPGISPDEQRAALRDLLEEQEEYERRGECGWQWVIDTDENGEIIADNNLGYGLRSLRIFDRKKLPEGITPQNLEADADKYGSEEMVQEMLFDISPMSGDKVRVKLINSWGAQEAAYKDPLTGLFNRRYFKQKVNPRMETMKRAAILFIDADKFKRFNDTYPEGHVFGDRVLKAIANAILRTVRGSDIVFRWSGEEFMVVIPEASEVNAKIVARNILTNVSKLRPEGLRSDDSISVTIGVKGIEKKDLVNVLDAIEEADTTMLEAKQRNMRGTVMIFGEDLPIQYRGKGAKAGEGSSITKETIVKDIDDITGLYFPALMRNLQEFLISEIVPGKSQGSGLHSIFMDLNNPDSMGEKLQRLEAFGTVLVERRARKSSEMVQFIARKHMRKLYLSFYRVRERMFHVVGDSPATKRVRNAIESVEKIMDLTFKYLTEEDFMELGILDEIKKSKVAEESPSTKTEKYPKAKENGEALLLKNVLERLEALFKEERSKNFSERVMSEDDFSETARDVLDTDMYAGSDRPKDATERKNNMDLLSMWLSKLMMGTLRFPGETRVIVYPVYDQTALAKQTQMASELRRRISKGDYGFKIVALPYLAGDQSMDQALEKMERLVNEDSTAQALIYAGEDFYALNNQKLRKKYGNRVFCLQEQGESEDGVYTFVPFYLRATLSLAVMDYFDPRQDMNKEHKTRLKDMIAAIIGMITGDTDTMDAFRQAPGRLINGLIVLRPSRPISWEELDEKMRSSEQFLHSL
ncbi:MAG: diguanylate cyclase [Candidatus Omnitrophica bacterium]|nr:diguanylate cyclase [Candidatus Omnitrophota bacterium]